MSEEPPYTITPEILTRTEQIGEAIGRVEAAGILQDLRLRRINHIRTIHGSLAIEGNTLSEEEISTILDGKPIAAPLRDIQEVRNAIRAYDQYSQMNPASETDLLRAHELLMAGLLDAPGHYRRGQVSVMGQGRIHHIGPPVRRVPHLMANLLAWLGSTDEHPLIAGSVFHYEFEFIHPFEDGNGRMGRLWQTLILTRWKPLFAHIPVESLNSCPAGRLLRSHPAKFCRGREYAVHYVHVGHHSRSHMQTPQVDPQVAPQVRRLLSVLEGEMSRQEIQQALGLKDRKSLRQRYLLPALQDGYIEMTHPDTPTARNQKYRRTPRGRQVWADLNVG